MVNFLTINLSSNSTGVFVQPKHIPTLMLTHAVPALT
jgi:hypothetical protein